MPSFSAEVVWFVGLHADGRAEHQVLIKVFKVHDAIWGTGRSTITIYLPPDRPLSFGDCEAELVKNGDKFHTKSHAQNFYVPTKNQLIIELPQLFLDALGSREPFTFEEYEESKLALNINLWFVERAISDTPFHKNELSYEFKCDTDAPLSQAKVEININMRLNWWQRKIAPLLAFPLQGSRKLYDMKIKPAGQMTNWTPDYTAGSVSCITKKLGVREGDGVQVRFRPVPAPNPITLLCRLGRLAYSYFTGTPDSMAKD